MKSPPTDQSEKKAAFNFFNAYLAVVYGLLVTDGLHDVVEFSNGPKSLHQWNSVNVLLFLGTFLISLHFWYACATVDDLSQDFYRILAGRNDSFFDLLLFFDAFVATAFAGFVLAMFQAIPPENTNFFLWFFCAAVLSLLYDFGSRFLVSYARGAHKEGREPDTIQRYGQKVTKWIKADFIVAISSAATYFSYRRFGDGYPFAFGLVFAVLALFLLLTDVDIWSHRKIIGRANS
jgi:ABC-type multidrug transport system permease subunit